MKRMQAEQGHMFYTASITDEDILFAFTPNDEWLSRRQIADRIWRSVNPAIRDRIERLVGEGKLEKTSAKLENGMPMYFYRLPRHE